MMVRTADAPYGTAPWHQTSWDARAAGNFIFGGFGSGLIVFTGLAAPGGAAQAMLFGAGLALVGLGLGCVALELGRPLRALNVFRNPRTSWMSREAIAGVVLALVTLAAMTGRSGASGLAAVGMALVFMYCQARLLQAARGIPAWRERSVVPLMIVTALAEGGGIFCATAPLHGGASTRVLATYAVLLLVRAVVFRVYRERIADVAPRAHAALGAAARSLIVAGTVVPLGLLALAAVAPPTMLTPLAALAGLGGAAAGGVLKFVIVTRAGFNRGFKLAELPVRGARP